MLVALRNKSSNFVMKLMLLFLAFSFALWGVGDIFRQGQPSVVAKVGTNKISGMDFARMIDRVANDKMPREMLKNPMILNQVLSGMINEQLILQESKRLGIRVGDEQAFKYISQDSLFKGASGKFDKEIFRRVLQSNNLSETGYIENLKTDLAANILLESYYVAELAPAAVVDAVASVRRQLREVEFVIIPTSAVATPTTADDAVIEAFYQKNIGAYTSAEMREISLVTLDRKLHTPKTEISEEELKKNYEEHKEEYRTAETRDVSHISFKNEDAAKKAFQALSSGASLETVAKEFSALNQGTLGKVTLKDMPEGTGAPVFTIKQGEYTQPVKRPFGWQIFHVSAVVPGKYKTLEEVRPALVEAIHALSNEEALQKIINQLEDELAGGATMQEAASKFNLPLAKLGPTTRDGKDAKGAALSGVPAIENLLETAFALDEGVESPVTRSKDGNFFLVKTEKVIKAEPTPLNSIKQEVTKAYLAQEKEKALATFAEEPYQRRKAVRYQPGNYSGKCR